MLKSAASGGSRHCSKPDSKRHRLTALARSPLKWPGKVTLTNGIFSKSLGQLAEEAQTLRHPPGLSASDLYQSLSFSIHAQSILVPQLWAAAVIGRGMSWLWKGPDHLGKVSPTPACLTPAGPLCCRQAQSISLAALMCFFHLAVPVAGWELLNCPPAHPKAYLIIYHLCFIPQGNIWEQIFRISFILEMINTVPFIITVSVSWWHLKAALKLNKYCKVWW